jgi:cell envelope opacity-associated protein A
MEFKVLFYIIIAVIFVGSKIYQGIKKANEELQQRQRENASGPSPQPMERSAPETIPNPWAAPKPAQKRTMTSEPRPVSKQKTIEEILEEMTRQYEKPATAVAPVPTKAPAQKPKPAPAPVYDQLGQAYPTEDNPYSSIDKLSTRPGQKGYVFDDSMAMSGLTRKDYNNILEEDDVLDKQESLYENFNPREAIKYATLLERKYQ